MCFEEKPGVACERLEHCRHIFCADCITTHARLHVKDGTMEQLQCLEPGCKNRLSCQVQRWLRQACKRHSGSRRPGDIGPPT